MIYIFIASLLILALFTIIALIRSGINNVISWIIIPLLIFNTGFGLVTIKDLKGWPINEYPPTDSILHSSVVQKPNIYILSQPKNSESPRLYRIPFTEKDAKKLNEAMQMAKEGVVVTIKQNNENLKYEPFDHTRNNEKGS